MGWTTTGADFGAMATGVSALTAASVWARNQLEERKERKRARSHRNWHGFIDSSGIDSWYVREVSQAEGTPLSRILVEVVDRNGNPDVPMAHAMRLRVQGDQMLARVPTPAEYDFLADLRRRRFGKGGYLVRFGPSDQVSGWPSGD